MTRAQLKAVLGILSVGTLASITGCGDIVPPKPVDTWSERTASPDVAQIPDGTTIVGTPADVATDGPSRLPAGANRTMKADAYWKLRALIGSLKQEVVSEDLSVGLDDTRKLIEETDDDEFKPGLLEVFRDVRTAWDAHKLEERLKNDGIDARSLPFSLGRTALESRLKEQLKTPAPTGIGGSSYNRHTDTQRDLLYYFDQHHGSPKSVRATALGRAGDKLEQVADDIDRWRKAHGDHPIGRSQNPAPGTRPEEVEHGFQMPTVPGLKSPIPNF